MNTINGMENKEKSNEIIMKYKLDKEKKEINIFGHIFVDKNKNNCKLIYNVKEYEIAEILNLINEKNEVIEIKLKGIKNVTNMKYMLCDYSSLLSLSDISKWNTSDIINMEYMFSGCSLLLSLPDISKWNTSNVITLFSPVIPSNKL